MDKHRYVTYLYTVLCVVSAINAKTLMKRHNDDGGGGYDKNDPARDHKHGADSQVENAPADKQHSIDISDIGKSSKDGDSETAVDHKSHDAGNAAAADDIHGGIKMGVKNEACDDGVVQCS